MVYGPIAAMLVEMFPTRIRYTSMSLPYHIGNGWFGGLLPTTAFAMVASTERKGTPLFGSHLPEETAVAVMHHVAEGVGTRKTARLAGVHRDTVTRYTRLAGDHAERHCTTSWSPFPPRTREVQFDEKWAFVGKKEKNCDPEDRPTPAGGLLGPRGARPGDPAGRQRSSASGRPRTTAGAGPGLPPADRRAGDAADHVRRVPGVREAPSGRPTGAGRAAADGAAGPPPEAVHGSPPAADRTRRSTRRGRTAGWCG